MGISYAFHTNLVIRQASICSRFYSVAKLKGTTRPLRTTSLSSTPSSTALRHTTSKTKWTRWNGPDMRKNLLGQTAMILATSTTSLLSSAETEALEPVDPIQEFDDEDLEGLPKSYDAQMIADYFNTKPGQLASRAALLTGRSVQLAALYLSGRYAQLVDVIGSLGPTFIKFGQALASRPDLVGDEMAAELAKLQDDISPIPHEVAVEIIRRELPQLVDSLSEQPIAAASLCSVYKAEVDGKAVAVKVQRPGLRGIVAADSRLLRVGAENVEKLKGRDGQRLLKPEAVAAVDEFCSRLFEEIDFQNEANNLETFSGLYGEGGSVADSLPPPGVKVPTLYKDLCTKNILVMEWLEGEKLVRDSRVSSSDLPLVELGIRCTLSQLVETGVMHCDPHGGNLLKVDGKLAYLDFGLVSYVPQQVRDGLVCAVALLVLERDHAGVANLFGDLMLLGPETMNNPEVMAEFSTALGDAADQLLDFSDTVPTVRFDQLITALAGVAPKYQFKLPPYFLNNARAIGTLEGMAKSADPDFNVISVIYPFACQRLLGNPTDSPLLQKTLIKLTHDSEGNFSPPKMKRILDDTSNITGLSKRQIISDALKTKGAWSFIAFVIRSKMKDAFKRIFKAFSNFFLGFVSSNNVKKSVRSGIIPATT